MRKYEGVYLCGLNLPFKSLISKRTKLSVLNLNIQPNLINLESLKPKESSELMKRLLIYYCTFVIYRDSSLYSIPTIYPAIIFFFF